MRFEQQTSARTAIKFSTDGFVVREAMGDANLASYGVVVLDEAHERSLAQRRSLESRDCSLLEMSCCRKKTLPHTAALPQHQVEPPPLYSKQPREAFSF